MRKILFVCLGNICRSPLAEGICLHLIKENNLNNILIDSAGTASYHVNEAPDKRTIANAKKHNVNLSQLKARQFNASDFTLFDEIYVMDNSNYRNVINLTSNTTEKEKVKLLLSIDNFEYEEVPDPYYGNENDFEKVFQLMYKASTALLGIK
ncbi:MAG: low molecular weight protein-tyrosine-phosphatase [Bacteroidia bacterium]